MKDTFKNVKVGQKLWSIKYGWVKVESVFPKKVKEIFVVVQRKKPSHVDEPFKRNHSQIKTYKLSGKIDDRDLLPDLYFEKQVITKKKRLSQLITEAKDEAFVQGQWHGYHESIRVLKLEFEEELQKRIKEALKERGLDPDTEVTIKGRSIAELSIYGIHPHNNTGDVQL